MSDKDTMADVNIGSGLDTISITGNSDTFIYSDSTIDSIDLSSVSLSGNYVLSGGAAGSTISIGAGGTGANGSYNWSTANNVTFTDPMDDMRERLEKLEAIIAEEKEIRDNCPAVRNAYDEYRFLLVLAKRNKGDLLTEE